MNISFFLLLITLFGLAAITNWNQHVLSLLAISSVLWASMVWYVLPPAPSDTRRFVMQLTAVQTNPENMPSTDMTIPAEGEGAESAISPPETRKDQ